MALFAARAASVGIALAASVGAAAAALEFRPIDGSPPAVSALATGSAFEAFALDAGGSLAVVSIASTIRYARGAEEPRTVPLAGSAVGLAVVKDGSVCYAVVRVSGRKGTLRNVDLVRIDLENARASTVAALPPTATGLAISSDDKFLLVAGKDEIRTFAIPAIASGPLYRVAGDNVGVAPIEGTSYAVVAQRSRVGLIDLSAPQGRDGLDIKEEAVAPGPLRGLLATAGEGGPVALADGGLRWRVHVSNLPAPVAPPEAPTEAPAPAPHVQTTTPVPPPPPPPVEPAAPERKDDPPRDVPGDPGTVSGVLTGPAATDVAAVVFLGPDNILREAARVAPDGSGRYHASALLPGSYRIVAASKDGRVLICRPPFISLRMGPNSAVEAPELAVLRAE